MRRVWILYYLYTILTKKTICRVHSIRLFSKFCIHFSIPPQTAFRQEGETVLFRHFTTGAM